MQKTPYMSTSLSSESQYRAMTDNVEQQIQQEIQRLGERELLRRIQQAARKGLVDFLDDSEIGRLSPPGRLIVERMRYVVEEGSRATSWDTSQLARMANDLAWAHHITRLMVVYLDNNSGSGEGKTCVTKCSDEYNKCMEENSCEYSWFCLCCMPCSLQYMGCVAKCTVGFGGGIFGPA